MKTRLLTVSLLTSGLVLAGLITACSTQTSAPAATPSPAPATTQAPASTPVSVSPFNAGDKVVALWSGSMWYTGTVGNTCATGLNVQWSDGSPATCVAASNIVLEKTPAAADLKVGASVLAQWKGSAFYNATITVIKGSKFTVQYTSDGSTSDVTIDMIRTK